jgi:hypothetical protein
MVFFLGIIDMSYIKNIKIVGKKYKLSYSSDPDDCGSCDNNKQSITLKKEMPTDLELDTIIHEVTHAIDYQMNLEMSERQVHGVGAGLAAVLIDNPKFIDYLNRLVKGE